MPAGNAYPSGHLVPSSFFRTCLCSNCWDKFSRTCRVFSRLFSFNTFSISLTTLRWSLGRKPRPRTTVKIHCDTEVTTSSQNSNMTTVPTSAGVTTAGGGGTSGAQTTQGGSNQTTAGATNQTTAAASGSSVSLTTPPTSGAQTSVTQPQTSSGTCKCQLFNISKLKAWVHYCVSSVIFLVSDCVLQTVSHNIHMKSRHQYIFIMYFGRICMLQAWKVCGGGGDLVTVRLFLFSLFCPAYI